MVGQGRQSAVLQRLLRDKPASVPNNPGSQGHYPPSSRRSGDLAIFTLNYPLKLTAAGSPGLNARMHWSKRYRIGKQHKKIALLLPKMSLPLVVTITRIAPARYRRMDEDNLSGACKQVRDGIAERMGVDDGDPRWTWRYQQEAGDWGIRIDVCPRGE